MKKEIIQDEYLQLKGLLLLAQESMKQVEFCEKSAIKILNIPQKDGIDSGHFGDGVWNGYSIEEILTKEGIIIKK